MVVNNIQKVKNSVQLMLIAQLNNIQYAQLKMVNLLANAISTKPLNVTLCSNYSSARTTWPVTLSTTSKPSTSHWVS